jgi:DNA-binding beta-propeller fold protein YncE
MSDLKECKIIDYSIDIQRPSDIIQTPCGKFFIGNEGHSIFRYCLETKQKFRIAGSVEQWGYQDGTRDESRFKMSGDLILSNYLKTLFVADTYNRVIRAICVGTGVTTTFAGQVGKYLIVDGQKEKACFARPQTLKLSPDGNTLYVSDVYKLRSICIATGQVNTIYTFEQQIQDFALSPDGKHIIICHCNEIVRYNLETGKSEIILKGDYFVTCDLSKDGQILFISNETNQNIKVVNLVTNQVIDTINISFEPGKLEISTNGKQLFVCCYFAKKIQVFDISKYCTNFKIFIQLQLSKHSFLPLQVINSFSI